MEHYQDSTPNHTDHFHLINPGCIKAVMRPDILKEAKQINPAFFTILRHWDDSLQHYDGNADYSVWVGRARHWFSTHIDGTFMDNFAPFVDAVSWHNEIWANSQDDHERLERIVGTKAALDVWNNEYRRHADLAHIKLVVGEAAVGNWMPREIFELAISRDGILGYHPYTAYGWDNPKERWEHDWESLSGLWDVMEFDYGLKPTWAFTEAGPFSGPVTGWKASEVCGGNLALYVEAVQRWIQDVKRTPAFTENRIVGLNLFTTGGGSKWKQFETGATELNALAEMYAVEWKPGQEEEPGPDPDPDPDPGPSEVPYVVVVNLLDQQATMADKKFVLASVHDQKETMTQSADDAARLVAPGKPGSRVRVWAAYRWSGDIVKYLTDRGVERVDKMSYSNVKIGVIVDELETNPDSQWYPYDTRQENQITTIAIHHTVGYGTPQSYAHFHCTNKGWPGIGYHFVIDPDGDIWQTNWLTTISFHANFANPYSIGIALTGDFTDQHPPAAQYDSALNLVRHLKTTVPTINNLIGHKEAPGAGTRCPGDTWLEWDDELREIV